MATSSVRPIALIQQTTGGSLIISDLWSMVLEREIVSGVDLQNVV